MKHLLTLLLMCLALAAGAHSRFYKSTNKEYPRVKEKHVLYGTSAPADAIELGIVVVETKKEVAAITDARKWASRNGANYLVKIEARDLTAGSAVANVLLHTNMRGKWVFKAYRSESELVDGK